MTQATVPATALSPGQSARPLNKRAHNDATESENKIHDDAQALRLGLRGGLVPGVTLYAYLSELVLPLLGPEWLRRGASTVRLIKPVYEGEEVTCVATRAAHEKAGVVSLDLAVSNPAGETCVVGTATLSEHRASFATPLPEAAPPRPVAPEARPSLTRESAPIGLPLAPREVVFDADAVQAYAEMTDDATPWYRGGSPFGLPLVPPGMLAGQPARLLRQNFAFGPSVHTNSEIQHLALPLAGGTYRVDACLLETFTKRGNDYQVSDVVIRDHTGTPNVRIRHTSIFRFAAR